MFKVAATSNFDSESYNESWAVTVPMQASVAKEVCKILNDNADPHGPDYYRVVDQNYKLYKFEP